MQKVTYFDVEYANSNNKSICQMGIMCENYDDKEPFYPERNIYLDPEDGFDDFCIKIHGITKERIKNELTFPEVWKDIEKYFTNAVVIGHNVAAADIDSLVKSLKRYNLDIPELYYICTLEIARRYIPKYEVPNYSMFTLCKHFGICIDNEHDAFDDACANADLFNALVQTYSLDVDSLVRKYDLRDTSEFSQYVSSPLIRKSMSEFYGIIRGFSIDGEISDEEKAYIYQWRKSYSIYANRKEIADILSVLDVILADDVVTLNELSILQCSIKSYLDIISSSPVTLATQILDGILRGITVDGKITEIECKNLRQWLYDNIYLVNHFPFNKTMEILDKVLDDYIITSEESTYITSVINEMLSPVESLKSLINCVEGKHICLSGNFEYGKKCEVEKYIVERGGIIDSSLLKSTNILMIGNSECQTYSNGNYGTKVRKAIEYNEKGCSIQIIKESDFFSYVQ